jgi:hypothetical protein
MAVGPSSGGSLPFGERWNGERWSLQAMPRPLGDWTYAYLNAVSCSSSRVCTAVGSTIGRPDQTLAERWNGRKWTVQQMPTFAGGVAPVLEGISCTSSRACTAVGSSESDGMTTALVERWDGTSWTIQTTPDVPGQSESTLNGVSCAPSSTCVAVGYSDTGEYTRWSTLAERWDGTSWSIQATPNATGVNLLSAVSCTSSAACTAVGYAPALQYPDTVTVAERWDGHRWSLQPTPNLDPYVSGGSYLFAVSCPSRAFCLAVGNDQNSDPLVEAWSTGPSAAAKLRGIPAGCVTRPFTVYVKGSGISSVAWSLDGKRVRSRTVHQGTRYKASIALSEGSHELVVRVKFKAFTHTHARVFHRMVSGCELDSP